MDICFIMQFGTMAIFKSVVFDMTSLCQTNVPTTLPFPPPPPTHAPPHYTHTPVSSTGGCMTITFTDIIRIYD